MQSETTVSPIKNRATKYMSTYLAVILFIVSFGSGILVGRNGQFERQVTNAEGANPVTNIVNIDRGFSKAKNVDFNHFWTVWDTIKEKYVKQPVSESDLFYGALEGMVAALNDPYSSYLPPKEATEFSKGLSGELEGIGAEIAVKNSQLIIVAPLPNTPAEKSGLKPGDKILFINKEPTVGMDVMTAVSKIRGKGGTVVTLTISRDGSKKTQDISITRAKINIPSVLLTWKPDGVAYLRVMQFNDPMIDELNKAITEIKGKKAKGLVVDLRNNPGGYLDAAIEMASEWIKAGPIVSERGIAGVKRDHTAVGQHRLEGLKTIVLVNNGSASASEIVAGALQDYEKATIIGLKTFGKGSVQGFENFRDGSALKITIAEWFTPRGRNINEQGITPDIEVKEDPEKDKVGEDKMLNKALELLKKK